VTTGPLLVTTAAASSPRSPPVPVLAAFFVGPRSARRLPELSVKPLSRPGSAPDRSASSSAAPGSARSSARIDRQLPDRLPPPRDRRPVLQQLLPPRLGPVLPRLGRRFPAWVLPRLGRRFPARIDLLLAAAAHLARIGSSLLLLIPPGSAPARYCSLPGSARCCSLPARISDRPPHLVLCW
jgi:hypothetical protein